MISGREFSRSPFLNSRIAFIRTRIAKKWPKPRNANASSLEGTLDTDTRRRRVTQRRRRPIAGRVSSSNGPSQPQEYESCRVVPSFAAGTSSQNN